MDTQIIENGNKNKTQNNGKSEILKKGAALTGAAVAGAGAMYGANVLLDGGEEMELDVPVVDIDANPLPSQEPVVEPPVEEPHVAPVQHQATAEPAPQESTPVVTHEVVEPGNPEPVPEEPTSMQEEQHINEIAEEIIGEDLIDPTDIDAPNLEIASLGTVTTADGQELAAAQIISETGDELYVVDVDNDNVYDYLADASGNVIGEAGMLTVGDAEAIITENAGNAGFLASNDNDGMTDDLLSGIETDIVDVNA